jgi:hypothetical protein
VVLLDSPLRWRVGGGCDVPLTANGSTAELTRPGWTCPLASADGLPFQQVSSGYQWTRGDVLRVDKATFSLRSADTLSFDFSIQVETSPVDPTIGPTFSFVHRPNQSAARAQ